MKQTKDVKRKGGLTKKVLNENTVNVVDFIDKLCENMEPFT